MNGKIIAFITLFLAIVICFTSVNSRQVFLDKAKSPIVIIDPGHGGMDGGAVGLSGVLEKTLNLEISEKISTVMGLLGIETKLTRTTDDAINKEGESIRAKKISDTKERVKMINDEEEAYLISVHLNHFSQASCKGAQVFYNDVANSKKIAESVQKTLKLGVDKENKRVALPAGKNIYLLSNVFCPSILVECGFLSNPEEEQLLQTEEYQSKIALSVSIGMMDALKDVWQYEN